MNQDIIIAKFGGTSMADAQAISQSAKVAAFNGVAMIVVSATSGTTNRLIELAEAVLEPRPDEAARITREIIAGHQQIAEELDADEAILTDLSKIFKEIELIAAEPNPDSDRYPQLVDHVLGFGEQLSSNLMIAAMNQNNADVELIDAREIIKTDGHFGQATPLVEEIRAKASEILKPKLDQGKVLVTQGFIGSAPDGAMTTLGRGGSDYSAALLAEALDATKLQIWTDVSGITSADPRIVQHAKQIEQMTFQEASELATAGAKILYPRTVTPLRRANIPLYVGNTFEPEAGGTTVSNLASHQPLVRAIALKTNQSILTLKNPEMAYQFGYLAKVFGVFAKFKVSIDQISTSEISIAVALEDRTVLNEDLINELKSLGEVKIEKGLSVISLIGNDVNNAPGLAQDIFGNLEDEDGDGKISVRMICQGASRHNFCFLVADTHGLTMVRKLHQALIE